MIFFQCVFYAHAGIQIMYGGWDLNMFESKFRTILRFGTLVDLVGHTQSQVGHLNSVIVNVHVGQIESVT